MIKLSFRFEVNNDEANAQRLLPLLQRLYAHDFCQFSVYQDRDKFWQVDFKAKNESDFERAKKLIGDLCGNYPDKMSWHLVSPYQSLRDRNKIPEKSLFDIIMKDMLSRLSNCQTADIATIEGILIFFKKSHKNRLDFAERLIDLCEKSTFKKQNLKDNAKRLRENLQCKAEERIMGLLKIFDQNPAQLPSLQIPTLHVDNDDDSQIDDNETCFIFQLITTEEERSMLYELAHNMPPFSNFDSPEALLNQVKVQNISNDAVRCSKLLQQEFPGILINTLRRKSHKNQSGFCLIIPGGYVSPGKAQDQFIAQLAYLLTKNAFFTEYRLICVEFTLKLEPKVFLTKEDYLPKKRTDTLQSLSDVIDGSGPVFKKANQRADFLELSQRESERIQRLN